MPKDFFKVDVDITMKMKPGFEKDVMREANRAIGEQLRSALRGVECSHGHTTSVTAGRDGSWEVRVSEECEELAGRINDALRRHGFHH